MQLVDADPRHAQHRVETVALPPFERDVCGDQRADENHCGGTVIFEILEQPLDLRPEQHSTAHSGEHPQRSARGVEGEKRQPADARRASERRSEQRDAGNELRNEEHVEPEALEPRLRLTHARIGRERDAAQYPHDPIAVTPAGDVPRDVGDDAPCQRHREHCDRGQFSSGGEPSGNNQRGHGRQRNPDLLDEHVAEDDCQSVLTDDGREVVGHRCARGLRRISISLSVPK